MNRTLYRACALMRMFRDELLVLGLVVAGVTLAIGGGVWLVP